jgi:subtilisin-like proprotein convertase family protein
VFVSGVVETPLVPEEAMGAFIGENPNGTWTITITDDAGGDTGSLNSWSLNIVTATCGGAGCSLMCPGNITVSNDPNLCSAVVNYPPPTSTGTCGTITCVPPPGFSFPVGTTTVTCTAPPTTTTAVYSSGNLAVAIPDNGTPVFVTINVPDTGTVTDVNARIRLNHTRDADLAIGLSHSAGGNALSNNNGGSGQNYGTGLNDCSGTKTIFDDSAATAISAGTAPFAGSFKPQSALTFHNGSEINGAWDLGIVDSVPMNTGTIGCFELEITRQIAGAMCSFTVTVNDTQAPTITCPPNISAALPSPGTTCTPVTYCPPTVTDNCPGATFVCNPPSGACIPPGTTTVTCTATDASGNMASCSFTVTVFNVCIQDDTNPNKVLLFITSGAQTGQYRFCCNGTTFTGVGTVKQIGSSFTLSHTPPDRRVQGTLNIDGTGTASLQNPPGTTLCTITDKPTIGVHTCICGSPGAGCP